MVLFLPTQDIWVTRGWDILSRYIFKRILMMIPVVLGVIFIVFTMLYFTPGDPAKMILGYTARPEEVEALREELGLNDPFFVQFGNYIKGLVLHGDLGTSFTTGKSVTDEIVSRFPTTLLLAILGVLVSTTLGIITGIISAIKQYSLFDYCATIFGFLGVSMPSFWLGLILIIVFSVNLKWLPPSGFSTPLHWILPAITIGMGSAAIVMRMTRSSMLEVIRQDYIRTAKAKGLSNNKIIFKHALRNALIPVITVVGLQFGNLLGGALVAETIFSIPGIGKLMVDAIKERNYSMVEGGVLFIALAFSFSNLLVDVLYSFIDPRIRSQYKRKKGGLEA